MPAVRQVKLAGLGIPLPAVSLPSLKSPKDPRAAAQTVLDRLAELSEATSNSSNSMTMAVTLDACSLESDSLVRFAAYASVIWGAQSIWWEGVGACAPIGSEDFALIAGINRRFAQWAEPLFLKAKNEAIYMLGEAGVYDVVRYHVTDVWSTSTLELPLLQGVRAKRPAKGDLIEAMDEELVVVHLSNYSKVAPAGRARALLFLSTAVSSKRAGAGIRQLSIQLHADVTSTKPIEPDRFQGFADTPQGDGPPGIMPNFYGDRSCFMSWYGGKMPLQLAGGSSQLVTYTRLMPTHSTTIQHTASHRKLHAQIGRRPLQAGWHRR